ncbi:MAG TPA: hypothetical protein VGQ76_14190 [Thermoanaerobaculia bacterium]|nr:hypothetical protein [Thermoanaerobaculia bacterium]
MELLIRDPVQSLHVVRDRVDGAKLTQNLFDVEYTRKCVYLLPAKYDTLADRCGKRPLRKIVELLADLADRRVQPRLELAHVCLCDRQKGVAEPFDFDLPFSKFMWVSQNRSRELAISELQIGDGTKGLTEIRELLALRFQPFGTESCCFVDEFRPQGSRLVSELAHFGAIPVDSFELAFAEYLDFWFPLPAQRIRPAPQLSEDVVDVAKLRMGIGGDGIDQMCQRLGERLDLFQPFGRRSFGKQPPAELRQLAGERSRAHVATKGREDSFGLPPLQHRLTMPSHLNLGFGVELLVAIEVGVTLAVLGHARKHYKPVATPVLEPCRDFQILQLAILGDVPNVRREGFRFSDQVGQRLRDFRQPLHALDETAYLFFADP